MEKWLRVRLREVAVKRNAVFVHLARNRPLSKNYEEVGVLGEWEFGKFCGLMPRLEPGKRGDGGHDFQLPVVFTVDVKTARDASRLLVEVGKVKADIYVLAWYLGDEDTGEVELVGWTWATHVKSIEPKDTGRGIVNHVVPASQLRPMKELQVMMGKVSRFP